MSTSQPYYDKLNTFSQKFPEILDDFKRNYVIFNQHPEFQEYSNAFSSSKSAASSVNKDLFMLTNDLQQNINTLNKQGDSITDELDELKTTNEELKRKLSSNDGTNTAADGMNDDAKEQFKYQYIKNLSMILGNGLMIFAMYTLFKNQVQK
jgi:regulator of replication initiation timing